MAKVVYQGPAEALSQYEAAVTQAGLTRKGAKNPYTSLNGHMFSFLDPTGLVAVRLSPELADQFGDEYETGPVEQHGRTMRGYLAVPVSLLANTDELGKWIAISHDWIGTLKPK